MGQNQYTKNPRTIEERFWNKVYFPPCADDCWTWIASKSHDGYGRFRAPGRLNVMAHRWAYKQLVGPIPDGLTLDHLCRNRACVNPSHLEPVTNRVNVLRGVGLTAVNATTTHCPQGHPYDAQNTRRYRGGRYCKACHNDYTSSSKRRAKAKAAEAKQ